MKNEADLMQIIVLFVARTTRTASGSSIGWTVICVGHHLYRVMRMSVMMR